LRDEELVCAAVIERIVCVGYYMGLCQVLCRENAIVGSVWMVFFCTMIFVDKSDSFFSVTGN
jgi:hypothetical protein